MKLHYYIYLSCIALTSGCTTLGPDFQKPEPPLADSWHVNKDHNLSTTTDNLSDWWTVFEDETLNTLIKKALNQNLTIQIAAVRIFEARAQLGIATGNVYPQTQRVRSSLNDIELSENIPNASPLTDNSFRDIDVSFDAAWELDIWGRFRLNIQAADANYLAEISRYDDALVSLAAEVASTYIGIRTIEARLAIARENVVIQKRSLEIASIKFENGLTSALDVEQAKTLLANTQASIPQLQVELQQAQNALSVLLGIPPIDLPELRNNTASIPTADISLAIGIPADLLRRRPDIRFAELQAMAQSAAIGIAEADLYPQFSLTGSLGFRSSDTGTTDLGDIISSSSFQSTFGPSFQWNILNYGRIKNAVRVEDARYQQSIINYKDTVLNASAEVENNLIAFLRGKQRIEFLNNSVNAAKKSVELAEIQYKDGAEDYTRVLDTQNALLQQQDLWTTAKGQIIRDLIATYKALGGGWQSREAKKILPEKIKKEMNERTDWGELLDTDKSND